MKNLRYILGILLLASSCKNVQKLVDKGQYDEAILFSLEKMEGEENRKTKYVKALEDAFEKVTSQDMEEIAFLKSKNRPSNWPRIHQHLSKIKTRQERIKPYLPLVSKDGYRAKFQFVQVYPMLKEASLQSAEYHYNYGVKLLNDSREDNDRFKARSAYREFVAIDKYEHDFKDAERLSKEANHEGQTRVWLVVENKAHAYLPHNFNDEIMNFNEQPGNDRWLEFYLEPVSDKTMDVKAILEIERLDVGPNSEVIEHHHDTKEVKHGWVYQYDSNGNVQKDSLGNDIKLDNMITVTAHTTTLFREKRTAVLAELVFMDLKTGRVLDKQAMNAEVDFTNWSATYTGDKRAFCNHKLHRYANVPQPFPHELDMLAEAITRMKGLAIDKVVNEIE